MHRLRRPLALLAAAAVVAAGHGANLDSLLNNSPFNQPAGPGASAASESLELRGVVIEGGRASLNIYDTTTKKASWVAVDEPGHPFLVRSFDASNDTATIEVNRRTLSLPLKRATVQLAAVAPVAPPPPPVGVNLAAGTVVAGQPQPAATAAANAGGAAPDQARLQAIADEIRRRRAMRAQNQGQAQPQPSAMPEGTQIPGRRQGNPGGGNQNQRRN